MHITSATFAADPSVALVTMDSGEVYNVDITLPHDEQFRRMLAEWRDAGGVIAAYVPPLPTLDSYRVAIQQHVDATAAARSYDSGATCSSYVNSTNPAWAAEASAFVAWRDAVWAHAYSELAKVEAGQRPQPSRAGIVAELPEIVWP